MQWVEIKLGNEGYNLLEEINMKFWVEELQIRASSWLLTLYFLQEIKSLSLSWIIFEEEEDDDEVRKWCEVMGFEEDHL